MKYSVADWERNGYHDSDFYALYFDSESKKLEVKMVGSTAYAGGGYCANLVENPPVPEELVPEVYAALARSIFAGLRVAEDNRVERPDKVARGEKVAVLSAGKFKDKKSGSSVEYSAGEEGEVVWCGAFGKFYANGYNKPSRHNRRVGVKFADGRVAFMALTNVKLARAARSDAELMAIAERDAKVCDPVTLFGGAWASAVYLPKEKKAA